MTTTKLYTLQILHYGWKVVGQYATASEAKHRADVYMRGGTTTVVKNPQGDTIYDGPYPLS
jgi:hypothetical protein